MRYNDPDVALSQSDEDKLLGLDPPPTDEEAKEGKFAALQVRLTLGTSSYATMALRQVMGVRGILYPLTSIAGRLPRFPRLGTAKVR